MVWLLLLERALSIRAALLTGSGELFQAVKKAKERLSVEPVVRIDIPEIDIDVRLERGEFEAMIAGPLEKFDQAVQKVLGDAGLGPSDVNVVLRTAGSALIPAFTPFIDERMSWPPRCPRGRVVVVTVFLAQRFSL